MSSDLLLQLGCRVPDDVTGNQSFSFFNPAQNELLHALILFHLLLCLKQGFQICYSYLHGVTPFNNNKPTNATYHSCLGGQHFHLTFFSRFTRSWACCAVCSCTSASLATASPSCLHSRGFCSPNSCTATPNSASEQPQDSHSSHRAWNKKSKKMISRNDKPGMRQTQKYKGFWQIIHRYRYPHKFSVHPRASNMFIVRFKNFNNP